MFAITNFFPWQFSFFLFVLFFAERQSGEPYIFKLDLIAAPTKTHCRDYVLLVCPIATQGGKALI